jgi:FKBP-type peptidyl-prolyl cis-trans isomerase (trigger factor)
MRKQMSEYIRINIERENLETQRNALLAKLVELNPLEIPESMTLHYVHQMAEDAVKQYNIPMEKAVKLYKTVAEYNLKAYHLQDKITELLDISITEEDKQAAIAEAAENMKMPVEEYTKLYAKQLESDDFIDGLKERKTFAYLLSKTKFIEPAEETEPEEVTEEVPEKVE